MGFSVRASVTGVVGVLVMVVGVSVAQEGSGNGLAAGYEDILSGYSSIFPSPVQSLCPILVIS